MKHSWKLFETLLKPLETLPVDRLTATACAKIKYVNSKAFSTLQYLAGCWMEEEKMKPPKLVLSNIVHKMMDNFPDDSSSPPPLTY